MPKRRILLIYLVVASLILLSILTRYSSTMFQYDPVPITIEPSSSSVSMTQLALIRSTRICCLVLTSPKNHLTRAKAINETWGPRCDRYFFVTDPSKGNLSKDEREIAKQLPIAPISNITGGYAHLIQKSRLGFLYAHEHYSNECEWFVKADDDTYLLVENLRRFLSQHDPAEPVTFGYNFKVIVERGYHSGGASYVLSRESLKRFHQGTRDPNSRCNNDAGAEDVEMGHCLRQLQVYPGKSLDEHGRELFHPLPFTHHFGGGFPDWMHSYAENPLQAGYNCCSDHSISFHYVSPEEIHFMDFLLYRARSPPPNDHTRLKSADSITQHATS